MKDKRKEKKAVVAEVIDSLQTSHFVSLMKGCWDYIVPQRDSLLLFNKSLRNTGRLCVCERIGKMRGIEEAILMPATTAAGSREKRRKVRRRLCLELFKCGSSGPQSLYQCHTRAFSSHLSAQRLLFQRLRTGKTVGPSPWMAQRNQQAFFFHPPCSCYLFTQHHSLSKCFFPLTQSHHICRSAEYWKIAILHLRCTFSFLFTEHCSWV